VNDLLKNPDKLSAMREAMRGLSKPDAAQAIVRQIVDLTGEKNS
jgi:UDP-N-acetylglucosamine:LPS N-acetylglucosamine transferase